jgi:hypothetical protein
MPRVGSAGETTSETRPLTLVLPSHLAFDQAAAWRPGDGVLGVRIRIVDLETTASPHPFPTLRGLRTFVMSSDFYYHR